MVFALSILKDFCTKVTLDIPINIASVHLVMRCPNSRAGVRIVTKKNPSSSNLEQPKLPPPPLLIIISGVAVGVALVVSIFCMGWDCSCFCPQPVVNLEEGHCTRTVLHSPSSAPHKKVVVALPSCEENFSRDNISLFFFFFALPLCHFTCLAPS